MQTEFLIRSGSKNRLFFFTSSIKCGTAHAQFFSGLPYRDLPLCPQPVILPEVLGYFLFPAAKLYAPCLGGGDTLALTAADKGALRLGHISQDLEHQIRNKHPGQVVMADGGVQKGHVQHFDISADLPGDFTPLLQNLPVIPSQPVDAFNDQQIPFFNLFINF